MVVEQRNQLLTLPSIIGPSSLNDIINKIEKYIQNCIEKTSESISNVFTPKQNKNNNFKVIQINNNQPLIKI